MTMIAETAGGQGSWGLEADREGGPASEGKIPPGQKRPSDPAREKSQSSDGAAVDLKVGREVKAEGRRRLRREEERTQEAWECHSSQSGPGVEVRLKFSTKRRPRGGGRLCTQQAWREG